MRVTIIGAGNVGSTIAYAIRGVIEKIHLVDINKVKAEAECLDIIDSCKIEEIIGFNSEITYSGEISSKSDIYIICVGKPLNSGTNEERITHLKTNSKIVESILEDIVTWNNDPWIIMVTNPSHELAKLALDKFRKVIACGRSLDIARTKVYGKHEMNMYSNHYWKISKGKGYTSWGIASEVKTIIMGIRNGEAEWTR
jgi:malate/lactate dehydrogenase